MKVNKDETISVELMKHCYYKALVRFKVNIFKIADYTLINPGFDFGRMYIEDGKKRDGD